MFFFKFFVSFDYCIFAARKSSDNCRTEGSLSPALSEPFSSRIFISSMFETSDTTSFQTPRNRYFWCSIRISTSHILGNGVLACFTRSSRGRLLHAPIQAWVSFFYLAVVSQFLAYVAWYSGMSLGGIARVSQIQYLQPFLMILFATIFLDESITFFTVLIAVVVVFSVILGKNATIIKKGSHPNKSS